MKFFGSVWRWIYSILMPAAVLGLVLIALSFDGELTVTTETATNLNNVTANGHMLLSFSGLLLSCKNLGLDVVSKMTNISFSGGNIVIGSQATETALKAGEFTFSIIITIAAIALIAGSLLTLIGHHNIVSTGLGLLLVIAGFVIFLTQGQGNTTLSFHLIQKASGQADKVMIDFALPFLNVILCGAVATGLAIVNFVFSIFLSRNK